MAREHEKSEWGEPGQPSEGGILPEDQPTRSRQDEGRGRSRSRHPRGTGGSNGTPASNN